jgi:hypothetical protein
MLLGKMLGRLLVLQVGWEFKCVSPGLAFGLRAREGTGPWLPSWASVMGELQETTLKILHPVFGVVEGTRKEGLPKEVHLGYGTITFWLIRHFLVLGFCPSFWTLC